MEADTGTIPAAGALLWRDRPDGELLIAVIHRPRYNDWSLPKGKLEDGESHLSCAYREVLEETGVSAVFGPELGEVIYEAEGITKVVRYWSAQASDTPYGQPNPEEVDAVQWLLVPDARKKLTSSDDRSILDFFIELGPDTTPLILLRHAKALIRDEWEGDDGDRPLDPYGQRQAKRLLPNFFPYQIAEIHSSDAMRCLETVEPMARSLQLNIVISEDLSEYRHSGDTEAALSYVQDIMDEGIAAVICSHNPILPNLMKKLIGKKNFKALDGKLDPSDAWVLHHRDGEIIAIDWMAAPTIQ